MKQEMNLMKLMDEYNSDDACREVLAKLRWPDGIECPHCQSKSIRNSYTRDQYDCASCGYQFSVTTGPSSRIPTLLFKSGSWLSTLWWSPRRVFRPIR